MAISSPPPAPRLLKDFLQDQTNATTTRKTRLFATKLFFINAAIKLLPPFKSVNIKPPSFLPRSISRRLSRSRTYNSTDTITNTHHHCDMMKEVAITVTVKDILRWKSFRDLATDDNEEAAPSTPSRCTTTTTSNSGRSSWCDSDFTAEDLPSWLDQSDSLASEIGTDIRSKKMLPVKTGSSHIKTDLKEDIVHDIDEESRTPVSVLDCSFRGNEELSLSRQQKKVTVQECESQDQHQKQFFAYEKVNKIEEEANVLVNLVTPATDVDHCLLLDFFRHELILSTMSNVSDQFEEETLRMAKAWLSGEDDGSLGWEMEGKREVCVSEMDTRESWNKFQEQQKEMTVEIEITLLNSLLDELLMDLTSV